MRLTVVFLTMMALTYGFLASAQQSEPKNKKPAAAQPSKDHIARQKIIELERQLKRQTGQITDLESKLTEQMKIQSDKVSAIESQVENQKSSIHSLAQTNSQNTESSRTGAVILLVGLLMELFGALLLGAPSLSAKIKELSDFEIKSGFFDVDLNNPQKEDILAFYSMIGNILLFLGFATQFAGTALVLSLGGTQQALVIGGGLFVGAAVLFWLLGIDRSQTRLEKIRVIRKNLFRVIALNWNQMILGNRQCDVCLKKVKTGTAFVSWYDEGNSSDYPYLHSPQDFKVGHEDCLKRHQERDINDEGNFETKAKIKNSLHLMGVNGFVATQADKYKKWFVGWKVDRSKARADVPEVSPNEVSLQKALDKIKKIDG
ncbi:MAG: hypothetical protein WA160_07230 [Pseudobdellovibrio sp.]